MKSKREPQTILRSLYVALSQLMSSALTFKQIADYLYQFGIIAAPESPYGSYTGTKRDYVLHKLSTASDNTEFLRGVPAIIFDIGIDGTDVGQVVYILKEMGYSSGLDADVLGDLSLDPPSDLSPYVVLLPGQDSDNTKAESAPLLSGLHPAIYKKCLSLYLSGEYSEASEKGFKVVRDRLRAITNHEKGLDAFGKGGLYIKGAPANNVDSDFQNAAKFLMASIDKFRNTKSHTAENTSEDSVRAGEYLNLSSLAMHLLDEGIVKGRDDEQLADASQFREQWGKALSLIRTVDHSLYALLSSSAHITRSRSGINISVRFMFHKDRLDAPRAKATLQDALTKTFGRHMTISVVVN